MLLAGALLLAAGATAACGSELRGEGAGPGGAETDADASPDPDAAAPPDVDVAAPDVAADAAADTTPPAPAPWIFGAAGLPTIELGITGAAWDDLALGAPPVAAELSRPGDDVVVPVLLSVTAVGVLGLEGKPSFRVAFEPGSPPPLDLATTPWIELDGMTGDPSHLKAQVGRALYEALGVPVPRGGYVWLRIGGADWGLYGAREPLESGGYGARLGGDDGALVAAARARGDLGPYDVPDLYAWRVPWFTALRGDAVALGEALTALVDAVSALEPTRAEPEPGSRALLEALGDVVDVEAYLDLLAADLVLSRYGYASGSRSYALVRPTADARWRFVADGLDGALGDEQRPWWQGGRLQVLCLADAGCHHAFGERARALLARFDAGGLLNEAWAMATTVRSWAMYDPRREVDDATLFDAQLALLRGLEERHGWLRLELDCADPAAVDHDGDGASACLDDCDDDDPLVHPGALERCNLRDDDCDGVIDNGEGCEPCVERELATGGRVAICFPWRSWAAAREDCLARGGDLVSAGDAASWAAVRDAALTVLWQPFWIGLNDRGDEGSFVWSDGRAVRYTAWSRGEPNDAGRNEDCVQATPWTGGLWNDLDCRRELAYLCSLPAR